MERATLDTSTKVYDEQKKMTWGPLEGNHEDDGSVERKETQRDGGVSSIMTWSWVTWELVSALLEIVW